MTAVDYDTIAEAVTTEKFAEIIGAEKVPGGWRCPRGENHEHADRHPSFSIFRDGRRIAAKCHSPQCGLSGSPVTVAAAVWGVELPEAARRLADAVGLAGDGGNLPREIVAAYDYTDEDGNLLFQVVRFAPKDFRQRRADGAGGWTWKLGDVRRVLYRLPAVQQAIAAGKRIFVVEGEKDVHGVEAAGYTGTCNPGGAGKWRPEHTEALRGANVVVAADRDAAGYQHARAVAKALQGVARRVVLVEPAVGKDISDHLDAGRTLAELVPIPLEAPGNEPPEHETAAARNQRIRDAALASLNEVQAVASWGWGAVDRLLGMLVAGLLYVIGARPSNGKTSLLLSLLSHLLGDEVAVLYFGTELPAKDVVKKWAAQRLGFDEQRVFEGKLTDDERAAVEHEIRHLTGQDLITFSTVTRLDLSKLVSEIRWAFDTRTGPRPQVIILDHLHRITQDREELEELARELKTLAVELDVAMIVACQLTRERDVGPLDLHSPPSLARYKGSAAIEENADVALGLYRPLRASVTMQQRRAILQGQAQVADFEEPNTMAVVCLKQRYRGKAMGRAVWLTVEGSRFVSRAFAPAPPTNAGDAWEPDREERDVPF